jgi:hypothetical protein
MNPNRSHDVTILLSTRRPRIECSSDAKRCITHLPLNTQGARHHDAVSTALEILFGKFRRCACRPAIDNDVFQSLLGDVP